MTFRDGDTFYPHHPDENPAGDYCVNSRPGDCWYLVVDDETQDIAWNILTEVLQNISWHIYPALVPYIAQFIINEIRYAFEAKTVSTNFEIPQIQSNYDVDTVLDDSISIKQSDLITDFTIKSIQSSFTLKRDAVSNFKILRVLDNTRTP